MQSLMQLDGVVMYDSVPPRAMRGAMARCVQMGNRGWRMTACEGMVEYSGEVHHFQKFGTSPLLHC